MLRRHVNCALLSLGLAASIAPISPAEAAASACAGSLTAQDFDEYLAAFNRNDFAALGRFYAPEVIFEGQGGSFRSRAEVLAFYRDVKASVRETVTLNDLVVGDGEMFADITTELLALRDFPDLASGALKKGELRRSQNFVWYQFEGREFVHIRSARYRRL